jgi:hypothetical protein
MTMLDALSDSVHDVHMASSTPLAPQSVPDPMIRPQLQFVQGTHVRGIVFVRTDHHSTSQERKNDKWWKVSSNLNEQRIVAAHGSL